MQQHVSSQTSRHPLWLLAGFWFCVVIAIAVVLRRLIELIRPSHGSPPQMAPLDATFSSHAVLTAMHIIPAAIFVLLSAALLLRRSGGEWPERLFFPFGAITGATAYAMSSYVIGGWVERSAVLVFDTWFLLSLGRAYWFRLRGETRAKAGVDDARRGYPARYCNHSSRHGSILRHQFPHASCLQPVLRHRVLDRLLHQRSRYRALVALEAARATPPTGGCVLRAFSALRNEHRLNVHLNVIVERVEIHGLRKSAPRSREQSVISVSDIPMWIVTCP